MSPRRGVSRHAPEPPRASPADARGSLPGTAESTPESHDKRAGAPADVEARPSPATVAFEPLPDDTACVAWTDHMRWLFHRLDEAIGPLSPAALDPDLRSRAGPPERRGLPRVESWVYTSPFARRVRFTYVDEGAEKQIFNAVVYPAPSATEPDPSAPSSTHLGDCPLLGVDLLCLAKGKNILVGLDLQPLSRDEAYLERYADDLKTTRDAFADLSLSTPSARFYEDARFFSPAMLFARPDARLYRGRRGARRRRRGRGVRAAGIQQDDVCGAEGEACGSSLVAERTLDAVAAYTEAFLALLDPVRSGPPPRAAGRGDLPQMDVASNVVVLEENQNIYDRAKRDRETAEEAEASLFAASDASDPSEASLGEMSETAARADASLAVAQASERAGAETIRAGSLLFGESAEATAAAVAGRRQRHARVLSAEETAAAQDAHDDWQRERDPAVLLFAGWFGKPWAERMANKVLFPRGLAVDELEET